MTQQNTDFYTVLNHEDASEVFETTSFAEAIAFASKNFGDVYSYNLHRLIYDGYRDEFLRK